MPTLQLQSINNFILKDVDLTIENGNFLVVLGPNGSGKTTLLNTIAGLTSYRGSVLYDGKAMDRWPTCRRKVGYLFQQPALFPHLNVRDNIAYGMKTKQGFPAEEISQRVAEYLERLNITHLEHRYTAKLSGGEKQRVALARALATEPEVLLLDEPMSSLDLRTAKYWRLEFRRLQRHYGITTVFVTHNPTEAAEIADTVAILKDGRLLQVGTPKEVLLYPAEEQINDFIGKPNVFECETFKVLENGLAVVTCGDLSIVVPYEGLIVKKIAIAPEHVFISVARPVGPNVNRYRGKICAISEQGSLVRASVMVGDKLVRAESPCDVWNLMGLKNGSQVYVIFKLRWINVLTEA
ncbi:MAG: ABC transporter ATP-binding protein [Desulfatiglandaceae bacterium]